MYTFWKRSVPPPNLHALDAPSREVCTVRRERTNTPLQALVLLNDPTFVEAARKLAERVSLECSSDPAMCIARAFELVVGRDPTEQERKILGDEYQKQLESFRDDRKAAEALVAVGESPRNEKLDAIEQAALTNVSLVILNLDEAVCRNCNTKCNERSTCRTCAARDDPAVLARPHGRLSRRGGACGARRRFTSGRGH
jgi:hypothetical protein